MSELPIATRMTFIGLWTYVDDEGRGVDDARLVKAELWPLDKSYTIKKVEHDLNLLYAKGLIRRYSVGTRDYLAISNWHEHQRINRPQESSLPDPSEGTDRSVSDHGTFSERSVNDHGGLTVGKEGKGRERKGKDTLLSAPEGADDSLDQERPEVVRLCEDLADRVSRFFEDPKKRPKVTARWHKDMRLLLERGPLGREIPEALGVERVERCLDVLFTKMTDPQGRNGFCWAAQIRSPHALREHWDQISDAWKRMQKINQPDNDYAWIGPTGEKIYR